MRQIPLPLATHMTAQSEQIVAGSANQDVLAALSAPAGWPYGTAILVGPQRSGKSLLARWFADHDLGDAYDDAFLMDETELFHLWNKAQEMRRPLLLVGGSAPWEIALPDLASRVGAGLHLEIGAPDDDMAAGLIEAHAARRALMLGDGAVAYLLPRIERSFAGIEQVVVTIDRLSMERKQAATMAIWRDALVEITGKQQPCLL